MSISAAPGRSGIGLNQDKSNEAIQALDKAIKLDPNNADAWNNMGFALKALGRTAESDAAFAKAKELGIKAILAQTPCL